jgi:hypothetical protein
MVRCPILYQNRFLQHTFSLDADLHVINLDDIDQRVVAAVNWSKADVSGA